MKKFISGLCPMIIENDVSQVWQKRKKRKRFFTEALSFSFKFSVLFLVKSHTVIQHFALADQVAEECVFVALTADQFILEVVLLHHEVL